MTLEEFLAFVFRNRVCNGFAKDKIDQSHDMSLGKVLIRVDFIEPELLIPIFSATADFLCVVTLYNSKFI